MLAHQTFKSFPLWSLCTFALFLFTDISTTSLQAQSSQRPFWAEQAMFRFGEDLFFVGVASCARTAEEGRMRAFEEGVKELREYAQDRDTSRLLVDTAMIYEEPNSAACPRGSVSVWRLLHVDQSKLSHLPRRQREEVREQQPAASDSPPERQQREPVVQDMTPQTGMSREDIVQRFGTPQVTRKKGREEIWEYSDTGLTITFSPKETLINWKVIGTRTPEEPSSEPTQIAIHKEPEVTLPRQSPIEPLAAQPPPLVLPKDPVAEGRTLFNGKGGCNTCHGRDADMFTDVKQEVLFGSPPGYLPPAFTPFAGPSPRRVPPNLRDWFGLRLRTDLEMARAIKDGIAGTAMTATRHLNDSEISALVAYLNSLR